MNSGGLATPSLPPIAEDPPPSGPRLPRPFLHSLRILFEILDDQGKGIVHISEIESRWGRGGSGVAPQVDQEIPAGVLQALQRVAEPCGGFLSFPRLVAGLRIALLQTEDGGAAEEEEAEKGRGAAQVKKTSRTRESDGKGVTRSRSTNSFLSQSGRCRMIPKESRRHTISGAVEYEMLKQMQQLERERDALLQGLEMVNQVRDWLQCHLLEAQKRQKQMGAQANDCRDSYSKQSCLLLAKIQEVNLCLKNLLTSSGKTEVPLKNWEVPCSSPENPFHQQAIVVLKEQNHLLTKEVSQKCHRIAQLEEEKASLCKQLKESWGYKLPSHKEFTFI
ncbi:suppressor APC domain-containing protein 1 isoform X1 [Pantherophis guttatus]|uniref:Suppressor APC domain-containing protein 1 isoform X1 n=1 Tax=Pantherophis guttatus TaxID=94885 RepID=A0A6P9CDP5_PANGU|nr:suppressor APC domain-containing protein 1 isoform X1 [Pantherophis guttatus]